MHFTDFLDLIELIDLIGSTILKVAYSSSHSVVVVVLVREYYPKSCLTTRLDRLHRLDRLDRFDIL